jgi:hypothetical protein
VYSCTCVPPYGELRAGGGERPEGEQAREKRRSSGGRYTVHMGRN